VSTPPQHGRIGDVEFRFPHGVKEGVLEIRELTTVKHVTDMAA
jgi:hypothetical protein